MKYCPQCGMRITHNGKFCQECGSILPALLTEQTSLSTIKKEASPKQEDYNDMMSILQNELNQRRKNMDERLRDLFAGSKRESRNDQIANDESPEPKCFDTSSPLVHHPGLEDESETKLGMFERIYQEYCSIRNSNYFQTFGYEDYDYAPLINLLAGIGEIELSKSLSGLGMASGTDYCINERSTYGDFIRLIETNRECRNNLAEHLEDIDNFRIQLRQIKNVRNTANHKGVITEKYFDKFFRKYYTPFFNETLPCLIPLKITNANEPNLFVIWTNTKKLSLKERGNYDNNHIENLRQYIKSIEKKGKKTLVLDASDKDWEKYIITDDGWESHHKMLEEFNRQLASYYKQEIPLSLFIIGGEDVIPMPKVNNPVYFSPAGSKEWVLEKTIEVDWIYSFPQKNIKINEDGCLSMHHLSGAIPRYFIGRLPLESGLCETVSDDIVRYFSKTAAQEKSGIEIRKVGGVTMEGCLHVMENTVRDFPKYDLSRFGNDYSYSGAFVCPNMVVDNKSFDYMVDSCISVLKDCELLTFILHGGFSPTNPSYTGNYDARYNSFPKGFTLETLSDSKAKVIVPISCWGARFIGYTRENSMLLHAIHNTETVLFMGSCRTVYGSRDINEQTAELRFGHWIVRMFMEYLLAGVPAGEALHRSKVEYLKKYSEGSVVDFLTILQFNLFGDPTLTVKQQVFFNFSNLNESETSHIPTYSQNDFKYSEQTVYEKDNSSQSLLDRVRGLVDRNMSEIRDKINDMLYSHYNISPDNLHKITSYKTGKGETGMRFVYYREGDYPDAVFAYTDERGNLKDVVYTF